MVIIRKTRAYTLSCVHTLYIDGSPNPCTSLEKHNTDTKDSLYIEHAPQYQIDAKTVAMHAQNTVTGVCTSILLPTICGVHSSLAVSCPAQAYTYILLFSRL